MRTLGIDCGFAITGWSVVEKKSGNMSGGAFKVIEYGVIRTKACHSAARRLEEIYDGLVNIIRKLKPDIVAVESLFYFKNQKTVMSVSQARGVVILAAKKEGKDVFDYTPLQVKQAVVGYGKATKEQVQRMVKIILNLNEIPKPDDAADALAIAICHINTKIH